jgi:A/G-specific adenine glycosylase
MATQSNQKFSSIVWDYYAQHGRTFPWRHEKDPYRVLVSEIMLQQTQVSRVLTKYSKFLKVFPTVHCLARSNLPDILLAWQGMGYNRRAKYLLELARSIVSYHNGVVPDTIESLMKLPGIGLATAAAISAYAYNKRVVFL